MSACDALATRERRTRFVLRSRTEGSSSCACGPPFVARHAIRRLQSTGEHPAWRGQGAVDPPLSPFDLERAPETTAPHSSARAFRARLAALGVVHRRGGYRDPESQASRPPRSSRPATRFVVKASSGAGRSASGDEKCRRSPSFLL